MRTALALATALLALPSTAAEDRGGDPVTISATPIEVPASALHRRVTMLGAWHLTSDHKGFGGISAMLLEEGNLTLVTDAGRWFFGRLGHDGGLVLKNMVTRPMTDYGGSRLTGSDRDAESLARDRGTLHVTFERDHRIHPLPGRNLGPAIRPDGTGHLPLNDGMEALAALPGGGLIAIAEEQRADGIPYWLLGPDGTSRQGRLPALSRHRVTGAETGPGGRLYLLHRFYSPVSGVSIRLRDYPLDAGGHPLSRQMARLAAWESPSGIDNMEGIAVEPLADGRLRIWLISDDNFNAPQRTILIALELAPQR